MSGLVQGVGFRPFAYTTAAALALAGSVSNTVDGVVIEVEGDPEAVREYGRRLREAAPPLAVVTAVHESDLPAAGVDILRGCVLSRVGEGSTQADVTSQAELEDVLTDLFALDLQGIEPAALAAMWDRMQREHERWTAAGRP